MKHTIKYGLAQGWHLIPNKDNEFWQTFFESIVFLKD